MTETEVLRLSVYCGCLMQLVSNTKVNLSQPLSLQLDCNHGNHSVVKTALLALFHNKVGYSHGQIATSLVHAQTHSHIL